MYYCKYIKFIWLFVILRFIPSFKKLDMKINKLICLIVFSLFFSHIFSQTIIEQSEEFLQFMIDGKFSEASQMLSIENRPEEDEIEKSWNELTRKYGEIIETSFVDTDILGKYDIVRRIVSTESSHLVFTFMFEDKDIKSFRYTDYLPDMQHNNIYKSSEGFIEETLRFMSGDVVMSASYIAPKEDINRAVVVFLHGSGPSDRDETIGPNKPFLDMAYGFAERGIGSFRFDKKTLVYPRSFSNKDITVWDEYGYDALAAIDFLINEKNYKENEIFILGHSLGGNVAPRVVDSLNFLPGGVILVAAGARPLHKVVYEQFEYLYKDKGLTKSEKNRLAMIAEQVDNVERLDSNNPDSFDKPMPLGIPAYYWYDLKEYNQCETMAQINVPVLVLQGKRDYQVTVKDFKLWKKALKNHPDADFRLFKTHNHIMMEGKGKLLPDEYGIPSNVSEEFIDYVSEWVKCRLGH
jgi:uncharacterized protein